MKGPSRGGEYDIIDRTFDQLSVEERYPKSIVVQDFRCQLATVRWLPRKQLQDECAHVEALRAGADGAR